MNHPLSIQLRKTEVTDLDKLFLFQVDKEAGNMAAFTPEHPENKPAYLTKFTRLLSEPTVNNRTIFVDNIIVGSIAKFEMNGEAEITYWIDRAYWGRGIAGKALRDFLTIEKMRPIFGRTAFDNFTSQTLLEKCGFIRVGSDKGFANARQTEIEEFIYKLD